MSTETLDKAKANLPVKGFLDIKEIQIKENDEVEYLTILKHIVALRNKEEILKQNK